MKRIGIIGCGGINSWVIKHLEEMTQLFDKKELIYIKLFDNDQVEEKNLLRGNQNFQIEDLMQQKEEVLANRYGYDFETTFITEENTNLLDTFDAIIMGVDNNKVRKTVYEYCLKKGKYLLDLRAQGTQIAFFILDLDKEMKYYNEKFFNNPDVMERKGSCQMTEDVEKDHIENGNKVIAFMGVYGVFLKYLRGEEVTTDEFRFVY